jgi:glycosyltransferase involved in cell wall biosynthesis
MSRETTVVIVTAHNEAERIGATLDALTSAFPHAPLWVADDGSTDDTGRIASAAGAEVLRSGRSIGKGGAATLAAREAMRALGDRGPAEGVVLLLCDGDLGACAGELRALVDAVREGRCELAVAAFATRVGGGVGLALGFARWAIRRRCGLRARAAISGQRALSGEVLHDVLPFAPGFGMEMGMTIDAVRAGHRVVEIELELEHRASGRTLAGFVHRARQLFDFVRAYLARR